MLKELFWDAFKSSGNIEDYILFKELDEHIKKSSENDVINVVKTDIS